VGLGGRNDEVARNEVVDDHPTNILNRFGKPDDVARILAFLLSDESDWVTGQIISAGGGSFRE
jgi:NAD(P)-dependent dehydrogenase (short-subunit alcohol dehydrogenase family)